MKNEKNKKSICKKVNVKRDKKRKKRKRIKIKNLRKKEI